MCVKPHLNLLLCRGGNLALGPIAALILGVQVTARSVVGVDLGFGVRRVGFCLRQSLLQIVDDLLQRQQLLDLRRGWGLGVGVERDEKTLNAC